MSDERELTVAQEIHRLKACEQVLLEIHRQLGIMWGDDPYAAIARLQSASGSPPPAEVMRAWVARSESGALGAFAEKPTRLDSLSGVWWNGKATWLPSSWFPTLAPGECWPVEIRRVAE